ncbi:NAD-dependent epimerase/dehydratase family protein [Croceitalea rosinachiae]|uniref:NAD-dependent epimerase/dehydratase family protein n=1 Tax=Croceitalea rosinachiae TaxID=3075596 RepID=A0ABU3A8Y7_9FLAO|nr:NAD-dependent epimerase/dehydratase family protein [Croceitalea sp. F388]MDT0606657.1 NAD-dependent epimerase/dehydratase family protein [Croceitalea sp. F388]
MILVTGGTGLVGAHLLLQLVQSGHKPRATYRTKKRIAHTKKVFAYYTEDHEMLFEAIDWVECNILDVYALEKAFEGITQVYHAAAFISFDPKDYKTLLKINIEGTTNVVNLCISKSIEKLCYVGSIAAIGDSIANSPIKESNEWTETSKSGYAVSKHAAEMEVWRASQEGVPVVIVNPGVILGPGFWKSGSGLFFYAAMKGPNYYLPNGTGFVSVQEVVRAMIYLMTSDIQNERFILVNENWSYKTLSGILAKGLNKKAPSQELKSWMLQLFWRFDWFKSNLMGKRRKLSKNTAKALAQKQLYDNSKIKKSLPEFQFDNLEKITLDYCSLFLKELEV